MEAAPHTSDAEFRGFLDAGDLRGAGTWLVQRHAHEVLGICSAMVHSRTQAEDLAQDVFGRAFAGLERFRGEASCRTWVLTIARNRCIDHLRSRQRDPWAGADPADPDLLEGAAPLPPDLLERRDQVEAALSGLTEGERALVVLRYRHGLAYSELADVFGLREGTARMRVSRALARMREILEPEDDQRWMSVATLEDAACGAPAPEEDLLELEADVAELPAPAPPPPRARAGLLSRVLGSEREPEVRALRLPHPLALYLEATDPGLGSGLQQRLLSAAALL